ncbi:hypothetical protein PSPO01_15832 [Paraphaeosphaeria sporulosa]
MEDIVSQTIQALNAWKASFKESTILGSFKVSGISPPDPHPVLDRFTRSQDSRESSSSSLSDHNWRKVDRLALATQKKRKKKGKALDLQQRDEYHGGLVF